MSQDRSCPICHTENVLVQSLPTQTSFYIYNCPRCGSFSISFEALQDIDFDEYPSTRAILSYWIRTHQSNVLLQLTREKIKDILESTSLPKPREQANNLILWMGNTLTKPQQKTSISLTSLTSIIGAYDKMNVFYIAEHLSNDHLIVEEDIKIGSIPKLFKAQLTFKGWERYDELQRLTKDSRLAFMAMEFGNKVLDKIFNKVIKDAVLQTGFEIRKLDEEKKAGLIDDKLRVEIRRSKFLIADLSDDNNGAYWEAGYAEGLGMQVIYICEEEKFKKKKTHFDTNHHLTIKWKDDPDTLISFAEELKDTIRATFPTEAKMEDD